MDFELRPITREELAAFVQADLTAFGERAPDPKRLELEWSRLELDRTLAAFDGDDIIGTGRLFSFELTLPGGALLPGAAVTWIAVLPTHRRRGVLTAIKTQQLEDAVERGESIAMLYASEGVIYRRFGYGMATSSMSVRLDRRHTQFLHSVPEGGQVRLVGEDAARKLFPDIFDRARRRQPGAVQRVEAWWDNQLFWPEPDEPGTRFFVVYESGAGVLDGYACYRVEKRWEWEGIPHSTLAVDELVTSTDEARIVLWRYLCDVDLIETIAAFAIPVDDPLRWLLAESRRLQVTRLSEGLWVRILDAPIALAGRRYATEGRVVFEVVDDTRPHGSATGRFELDGGPDGAQVRRTTAEPELVLDVADLGAAYLGGVPFSTLARAGLVEEGAPGALRRADAMFAAERLPFGLTWF